MPGTPSIWNGRRMPCQWIEVGSRRRLVTRRVTVSPSRQRSVGPGSMPLMVVAMAGLPVKLTGVSSITRSNSVPRRTGAVPSAVAPAADDDGAMPPSPSPAITPPAASPCTNRRRGRLGSSRPDA